MSGPPPYLNDLRGYCDDPIFLYLPCCPPCDVCGLSSTRCKSHECDVLRRISKTVRVWPAPWGRVSRPPRTDPVLDYFLRFKRPSPIGKIPEK